ncbi:MAG: PAS domain-containing protein, partial [Gemmatimonadota bacterium]
EEMQSINEELQSTNEELETSKEEMQSVNEELSTVNVELQTKLTDLSRVNNDMNNLLAGTGIATVFVDHALRILRFTPGATRIINLIDSDVGRPVSQIVANFSGYDALVADTNAVLDTLVSKAQDVQTTQGAWFAMRIQPYRTVDNVIEGAVLTFVDIAAAKKLEIALRDALAVLQTYPATQIVELDTGRAVEDVIKRAQAVLEQRFEGQTAALSHIQTQVEHQPHDMKNDG